MNTDKLELVKYFDTIVKDEDGVFLCKKSDIYDGVFGCDLCDWDIYLMNDNGELDMPNQQLNYSSAYFVDMYERVEPGDEDKDTLYLDSCFSDEKIAVRKLKEVPSEIKQLFVNVVHGIRMNEVTITDADIIQGKVYKAPLYTPQDYPNQEYEDAFLFVDNEGKDLCIKRTSPFYTDDFPDSFDEISEKEFLEFCE